MNFALGSHVLIADWVPGFLLVMALRPLLLTDRSSPILKSLAGSGTSGEAMTVLAMAVLAFFAGQALDALRDLLEHLWDWVQPIRWEFLVTAEKEKVENFRAHYFTFYVFDCNVSLALFVLAALACFTSAPASVLLALAFSIILFVVNAILIRTEMADVTGIK